MNPKDPKAELQAAIQKLGDRLVELRFAERFLWDSDRKIGRVLWTESGAELSAAVRKIYEIPQRQPQSFTMPELIAFAALFISCEAVEEKAE